jgi:hypothetical protein
LENVVRNEIEKLFSRKFVFENVSQTGGPFCAARVEMLFIHSERERGRREREREIRESEKFCSYCYLTHVEVAYIAHKIK